MNFGQMIGDFWWLIFPLSGIVGGWVKAAGKFSERRRRDKIEMLKLKQGANAAQLQATQDTLAEQQSRQLQIQRLLATHDEVNRRWFDYELNVGTLIDYPMMIDMREPLTVDFHRAKLTADELRPSDPASLSNPAVFAEYRDAVHGYQIAFDIAERESKRRRRSGFSPSEQSTLARARKLVNVASDDAATPAERQAAYRQARRELDGLIVLPERATARLESRIAGVLEPGPTLSTDLSTDPAARLVDRAPNRDATLQPVDRPRYTDPAKPPSGSQLFPTNQTNHIDN